MDTTMIVLRLVHIFAGIFWVGASLFMTALFVPAVRAQGPQGGRFMHGLLNHSRFNLYMPLSALLTTVAGVLLYIKVSDTFNADWIETDGGIVMTIGAVAGLLAFGHGASAVGPLSGRVSEAMKEVYAKDGPPAPDEAARLQELTARLGRNAQASLILMIIAVVGMSAARYM